MRNIHKANGIYEAYFKRPLDFLCSVSALVVFLWVFVIVGILVRIKLGTPILFTQERTGLNEKVFKMYKFRSMTDDRDEFGELLPDTDRLTSFGKWLRATSLDEIPELFNIIKGDMSIIGPRPLVVSYLPYYTNYERQRHSVRPGLTGLAQVNGRNSLSWEKKFSYDVEYAKNITFVGDLKILYKTVMKVINREDIGQGEEMPKSLNVERRGRMQR